MPPTPEIIERLQFLLIRCLLNSLIPGRLRACPNEVTNPRESDLNPLKINPKSMKIWSPGILGQFWSQFAPRSAQGHSPEFGGLGFRGSSFEEGGPKGAFLDISKIENGAKTTRMKQDRHRDRQNAPRERF